MCSPERPGRILAGVTPLQRYIAEEIATDHVDGLMSRREALRRLALLGMGTAAATTLIAACGDKKSPARRLVDGDATPRRTPAPPGMATAVPTDTDDLGRAARRTAGQLGRRRPRRGARCW